MKMPQIRAQVRPIQAGKCQGEGKYRSCRDAPHVVYGRRTRCWTPGPRTPLFRCLLVSYRTLSLEFRLCKAEGARARATASWVQRA